MGLGPTLARPDSGALPSSDNAAVPDALTIPGPANVFLATQNPLQGRTRPLGLRFCRPR